MYDEYVSKYPNIGRKWDVEQNTQLLELLKDSNRPMSSIAYEMGRSENAVTIQSVKVLRNVVAKLNKF